jgi:hypothetical protein
MKADDDGDGSSDYEDQSPKKRSKFNPFTGVLDFVTLQASGADSSLEVLNIFNTY